MTRPPTLAEAMRMVREADPAQKLRQDMFEAVKGENIVGQRATPAPSFAAQDPRNTELLARQQEAHDRAQRAEAAARERRVARLEEEIRTLQAGQTEENKRLIAATAQQGG